MWDRMNSRFPYTKDLKRKYDDLIARGRVPEDGSFLGYLEDLHRNFRRTDETMLPFHEFALRAGVPAETLRDEVRKTGLVTNNYILRDGLREIRSDPNYKLPKKINTILEYALQASTYGFWDEIQAATRAGGDVLRGDSEDFWKSFHRHHRDISEDMRQMLQDHPEMILAEMLLSGGRVGGANIARLAPKSVAEMKMLNNIRKLSKEKLGDVGIEAIKSGVYTAGKTDGSLQDRKDGFLIGMTAASLSVTLGLLGRGVARQFVDDPLDKIIGDTLNRFFRPAIHPTFSKQNHENEDGSGR